MTAVCEGWFGVVVVGYSARGVRSLRSDNEVNTPTFVERVSETVASLGGTACAFTKSGRNHKNLDLTL